jgi:hypothetical protein
MTEKSGKLKKHNRTFKTKDFISGDGMMTAIWGPSMWHFLHTMSFNYPISPTNHDKTHYREFIISLQNILPCKHCRQNLKNNMKIVPLKMSDMKNRDRFSRYVYGLHEMVNTLLGKKSNLTYCDVRERYEHFRSRCTLDKPLVVNVKKTKELGCTEPLYGKKAKCIIKIVPHETKCKTLDIDKSCIKKKI